MHASKAETVLHGWFLVVPVHKVQGLEKLDERRFCSEANESTVVVEKLAAKQIIDFSAMGWSVSRRICWTSVIWSSVSQVSMQMERDASKLQIRRGWR